MYSSFARSSAGRPSATWVSLTIGVLPISSRTVGNVRAIRGGSLPPSSSLTTYGRRRSGACEAEPDRGGAPARWCRSAVPAHAGRLRGTGRARFLPQVRLAQLPVQCPALLPEHLFSEVEHRVTHGRSAKRNPNGRQVPMLRDAAAHLSDVSLL